jgi:hypothetical protein
MWIKTSKPPASLTLFACTSQAWLVPFDGKSWALYIMVCICQHNYLLSKCLSTSHLSKNNYGYIHWIYIYLFIPKWHIKYIHVCICIYIYTPVPGSVAPPSLPQKWSGTPPPSQNPPFACYLQHFRVTASHLLSICCISKPQSPTCILFAASESHMLPTYDIRAVHRIIYSICFFSTWYTYTQAKPQRIYILLISRLLLVYYLCGISIHIYIYYCTCSVAIRHVHNEYR